MDNAVRIEQRVHVTGSPPPIVGKGHGRTAETRGASSREMPPTGGSPPKPGRLPLQRTRRTRTRQQAMRYALPRNTGQRPAVTRAKDPSRTAHWPCTQETGEAKLLTCTWDLRQVVPDRYDLARRGKRRWTCRPVRQTGGHHRIRAPGPVAGSVDEVPALRQVRRQVALVPAAVR